MVRLAVTCGLRQILHNRRDPNLVLSAETFSQFWATYR
jgi:hypothetical protein